jgi:hypothetical protein
MLLLLSRFAPSADDIYPSPSAKPALRNLHIIFGLSLLKPPLLSTIITAIIDVKHCAPARTVWCYRFPGLTCDSMRADSPRLAT